MGQYHLVVNLDKKEYLHPHHLGDGFKLMEFGNNACGTMTGLAILLAVSNGRGGGDLHASNLLSVQDRIGSWGGDRIAIVGDYAEDTDLDASWEASKIFRLCLDGVYKDISSEIRQLIEADGMYTFTVASSGFTTRLIRSEENEKPGTLRPDIVMYSKKNL